MGQPDVTNYADTTPDADIDYDRMGRKTRESNGTATSIYQYSATTLRPTLEIITYDLNRDGTPELSRQLDRSHDNLRRPTGFTLKDGTTTETAASYGYDVYSRITQISNPLILQLVSYAYTPIEPPPKHDALALHFCSKNYSSSKNYRARKHKVRDSCSALVL